MKAIFGLGNFGPKYAGTKHNMGFDTVTRLSDKWRIPLDTKKFKGLCGFGWFNGEKVILIQPQTYMNNSGECVREICDFFKLSHRDILVIYDDISLPPGQLRLRKKGSAGGHNGIKSVIAHLGTDEFDRVKIGVGEKPAEWDLADYVLSRFSREEEPLIREAIDRAALAVETILSDGIDNAMGEFNRKTTTKTEDAAHDKDNTPKSTETVSHNDRDRKISNEENSPSEQS